MQRVVISVLRRRAYAGGDWFAVYGDGGGGSIDYGRPIGSGAVRFWPGAAGRVGHLLDGHLFLPHFDSVRPDGHLSGLHLLGEHFWPAPAIRFDTPEYYYGVFKHVARTYDALGNCRSDDPVVVQTVVNSSPRSANKALLSGYDKQSDRVTIEFEQSVDLGG